MTGQEMHKQSIVSQDERILASLAHGSILIGAFTNGIGGIATSLIIWLTQKEKSAYVSRQALQALIYQSAVFLVTWLAFCLWGAAFFLILIPTVITDPACCQNSPPPGMWAGLVLMVCPLGFWFASVLYGLWAAIRCLGGHDFSYVIIGTRLDSTSRE